MTDHLETGTLAHVTETERDRPWLWTFWLVASGYR